MVRAHSPESGSPAAAAAFVAAVRRDPEGAEARVYRTWMRDVLQPLNERAAAIVVDVSMLLFTEKKISFFFPQRRKKLIKDNVEGEKMELSTHTHTKKQHADLLESSHMPALLLQLVAHVSANRVVLSRWAQGESGAASAIAYPDALPEWASSQFRVIKARQALLLGVKGSFSGGSAGEEELVEGQFDDYDDEGGGDGRWERAGGGPAPPAPPPPAGEMGEGAWDEPPLLSASSKL